MQRDSMASPTGAQQRALEKPDAETAGEKQPGDAKRKRKRSERSGCGHDERDFYRHSLHTMAELGVRSSDSDSECGDAAAHKNENVEEDASESEVSESDSEEEREEMDALLQKTRRRRDEKTEKEKLEYRIGYLNKKKLERHKLKEKMSTLKPEFRLNPPAADPNAPPPAPPSRRVELELPRLVLRCTVHLALFTRSLNSIFMDEYR